MPFEKGRSGNPGGRPKEDNEVKRLARAQGAAAIARLAEWMVSDNPKASVAAAQALLDRGFGKPTQPLANDEDSPLFPDLIGLKEALASRISKKSAGA